MWKVVWRIIVSILASLNQIVSQVNHSKSSNALYFAFYTFFVYGVVKIHISNKNRSAYQCLAFDRVSLAFTLFVCFCFSKFLFVCSNSSCNEGNNEELNQDLENCTVVFHENSLFWPCAHCLQVAVTPWEIKFDSQQRRNTRFASWSSLISEHHRWIST